MPEKKSERKNSQTMEQNVEPMASFEPYQYYYSNVQFNPFLNVYVG